MVNSKPVFFIDLDDTIFQTDRKLPQAEKGRASVAALDREGRPLSLATRRQGAFFSWLGSNAVIVPVTGRSVDGLSRVLLPFHSWKIAAHGAVILNAKGERDQDWQARVSQKLQPLGARLEELARVSQKAAEDLNIRCSLVRDCGLPLYLVFKEMPNKSGLRPEPRWRTRPPDPVSLFISAQGADIKRKIIGNFKEKSPETGFNDCLPKNAPPEKHGRLSRMKDLLRRQDIAELDILINDNNLTVLPRVLGKAPAVARVLELLGDIPFCFGLGDSLSDLPFLSLCDWWGTPVNSQLAEHTSGAANDD